MSLHLPHSARSTMSRLLSHHLSPLLSTSLLQLPSRHTPHSTLSPFSRRLQASISPTTTFTFSALTASSAHTYLTKHLGMNNTVRPGLRLHVENQKRKGEGGGSRGRGRVPERTGKRSRCCGFAEVLGLSRAELSGTNIGFRDFKMTTWSFRTSLTKWEPLTRPGWRDIE